MSNTATRLLRLILLLQEKPNQKAEALAEKLEVSIRTLHRYMSMLEEMGIPIYTERGPYGGFSLMRGYKMPPLIFSPQEAIALVLGTQITDQIWGELYHQAAMSALSKLEHVLPEEQLREVRWAQSKLVSTGFQRLPLETLEPDLIRIRQAMHEEHKLQMLYQSQQQTQSMQRIVHPYHLVHRAGLWYLIAWCEVRQAMRSFRVDRIRSLEISSETFAVQTAFDLETYLQQSFEFETPYKIQLHFSADFADLAKSVQIPWNVITENPDGSIHVEFTASDLHMAASMALSFGPSVEILQPPALIDLVREWAEAVVSQYT
ncbi:MAG: YafY family transcriptional regulator [Anaerolineaceae bacterium]|nr:YafY family transcriptional regulator [Anaerolineaceae bacterium]